MSKPGLKPSRRVTLSDIASRAGVSVSTVSLVLANKAKERYLSDELIERVRKVAAELDYTPNLLVQSMQRGRTDTLVFYNAFRVRYDHDLYLDLMSTAVELAGGRHGFDILVHCVFNRSVEDTYRHINGGRCDGMLFFAPTQDDPLLPYLRKSRLPTVLINSVDSEGVLSYVKDDNMDGLRQIADALCGLGHRRVAALSTAPTGNQDGEKRVWLLREMLASRGVAMPERWILKPDGTPEDAEAKLRFLMSEPTPPTAIFCWHDRLGYQILEQCEKMGIRLPDQLSMVGYDGIVWPAKSPHTLASVKVDLENIAEEAVTLLEQLINGDVTGPVGRVLAVSLDHGTTLGQAPA